MVSSLVNQFRADIDGELCDRSRVVDQLLDLRLAVGDRSALVATVDRLLAELPGRTAVPSEWWAAALDELEGAAAAVGATPSG